METGPPPTSTQSEEEKVQPPSACTQSEEKAQPVHVEQEVREDHAKLCARLAAETLEQEIRHQKFLDQVAEVRTQQDQLYECLEEQRIKTEGEESEDERDV